MELHYYTITTKSPQHDASGNVEVTKWLFHSSFFHTFFLLMEWNTMEENYFFFMFFFPLLFVNTSCGVFHYLLPEKKDKKEWRRKISGAVFITYREMVTITTNTFCCAFWRGDSCEGDGEERNEEFFVWCAGLLLGGNFSFFHYENYVECWARSSSSRIWYLSRFFILFHFLLCFSLIELQ